MDIASLLLQDAQALFSEIKTVRRALHHDPELSFKEVRTSQRVVDFLEQRNITHQRIATTGVIAIIEGRLPSAEGKTLFLRADMDALPIIEKNDLSFASTNGAMHACGHDMHTASLLGGVAILDKHRDLFNGTIIAIFQPGEERNPGGASLIIKSGLFDRFPPRAVVGLHVDPDIPVGQYGLREGQYMASTDEIRIAVKGKGGHGALPHTTHDPIVAASALVLSLQTIVSRSLNVVHPTVLSLGRFMAEGGTNIIPDTATLEGTLRTMTNESRQEANRRIREIAAGIAAAYEVTIEVATSDGFPSVINDIATTRHLREVLCELVGNENVHDLDLRMTGEDFGHYATLFPSVFFRLGVKGAHPSEGLHSARFCPDEQALIYGMAAMAAAAIHFTPSNKL